MIGLLSSSFCTPPQKVDLLEGLMQMFRNKAALINIFYNYDNDIDNWPVCQNLVATVSKLTEGEYFTSNKYGLSEGRVVQQALRLLARFMELMAKYLKAPALNAGGNLDEQDDYSEIAQGFLQQGHTGHPQNYVCFFFSVFFLFACLLFVCLLFCLLYVNTYYIYKQTKNKTQRD